MLEHACPILCIQGAGVQHATLSMTDDEKLHALLCLPYLIPITVLVCLTGDRYDEAPRRGDRYLDEIDDWSNGRKSVVGEAIDKAKDLWNRTTGRHGPEKYD